VSTGHPHKTGPLVNLFLEKCKNPEFLKLCQEELLPVTNRLIHLFLEADMEGLYEQMKILSAFQLEHFAPMIPTEFKGLWKAGLKSDRYLLKLCGAGGGGFLLGMSKDFSSLKLGHQVRSLFSF
jgi:mevalonate kinase